MDTSDDPIITPILLGSAATAATATTAATAATTGLIGTAGAFSAGTALVTTGIGLGVAGGISAAQSAGVQGESAQNIADFNAKIEKREAQARRDKATFESKRQASAASRRQGATEAAIAAAGGAGSPVALDLAAEQASEDELENLLIGFEGRIGAGQAESQAELDRLSGRIAKKRGKSQRTGAFLGAGSSLLTGFGSRI